jgi:hypothetical protein
MYLKYVISPDLIHKCYASKVYLFVINWFTKILLL